MIDGLWRGGEGEGMEHWFAGCKRGGSLTLISKNPFNMLDVSERTARLGIRRLII